MKTTTEHDKRMAKVTIASVYPQYVISIARVMDAL